MRRAEQKRESSVLRLPPPWVEGGPSFPRIEANKKALDDQELSLFLKQRAASIRADSLATDAGEALKDHFSAEIDPQRRAAGSSLSWANDEPKNIRPASPRVSVTWPWLCDLTFDR